MARKLPITWGTLILIKFCIKIKSGGSIYPKILVGNVCNLPKIGFIRWLIHTAVMYWINILSPIVHVCGCFKVRLHAARQALGIDVRLTKKTPIQTVPWLSWESDPLMMRFDRGEYLASRLLSLLEKERSIWSSMFLKVTVLLAVSLLDASR